MLCLKGSGRDSGVPEVPTDGGPNEPSHLLTTYLTAYGFGKQSQNVAESAQV
jgi:hypothetical protein